MAHLTLFNFILQNFQYAAVNSSVIFHCWENKELKIFAQQAYNYGFYTQCIDLYRIQLDADAYLRRNYLKLDLPVVGVFLDMNCRKSLQVLKEASFDRLFSHNHHWLLYDEFGRIQDFHRLFEHANVTVNSDMTYAFPDDNFNIAVNSSSAQYFLQYDVYNNGPHIGGKLNMTIDRRTYCSSKKCKLDQYLSDLHKRSKYGNRNRQNDISLRVATIISYRPLTASVDERLDFLQSDLDPNSDTIARFGFHQLTLLRDMLQTNLDMKWLNQWSFNDTSGGALGDLISEAVDYTSTPFAVTLPRLKLFVIVAESGLFHSICLFRTPPKAGLLNTGEVYLDPFDGIVWFSFGITIIIGALLLWLIFSIERYRMQRKQNPESPSFFSSFLISFGTVCAQGSDRLPTTAGGRICYSVLILASFIMYNYYTSVIVSTLLGAKPKSDIKTLAQLVESSLEVGVEPIPYNFAYLNVSKDPAVRRLVERKIKSPSTAYIPVAEGVKRVRDRRGKFAYVFNAAAGYQIVEKFYEPDEICDLNEVMLRPEKNLNNILYRNSSFIELFRLRLLRSLETGVNRRILKYWMRDRLFCFPSSSVATVGLENTAPLFFLLLIAFVLSFLVLILEINWYKLKNKSMHPEDSAN